MSRLKEIQDKLQYAEHQRQSLMNTLFVAKKEKKNPQFIVHTVADILSSSRECYDYCARDIIEEKVIPNTKNQIIIDRHNDGKLRAYFPFYRSELTNKNNPFSELDQIQPFFHNYLLDLADNIDAKNPIPNTLFNYGNIIRLKDIVNEKKHDRLIAIETNEDQEILIENLNMKMIIPVKKQKGWNKFQVSPDSDISRVVEYRLEYLDEEVCDFCMFATVSTKIVLEDIYAKYFT